VSPLDNDPEHMQAHMMALRQFPPGTPQQMQFQAHMAGHQMQMQAKAQVQVAAATQVQGMQGGRQRGGGGPRQPQPGSQPTMPRQGRQPPGRVHPDVLNRSPGVVQLPRRM
jgi:hypothetical protein